MNLSSTAVPLQGGGDWLVSADQVQLAITNHRGDSYGTTPAHSLCCFSCVGSCLGIKIPRHDTAERLKVL